MRPFVLLRSVARSAFAAAGVFCALAASGQTILNGSFEQMAAPPSQSGQWSLVQHWTNSGSSIADPDAYHLDGTDGGDLPETPVAMVQPHHGRGIMGFKACGPAGANEREYLSGKFSAPLTPGQRYVFSFYITNGELTAFSQAGLAAGGLGVSFSTAPSAQTGHLPLNASPTFRLSTPLYDDQWRLVSFNFTAAEAWTDFSLGVFGPDDGQVIEYRAGDNPQFAYYFVDHFELAEAQGDMEEAADAVRGEATSETPEAGLSGQGWFVPNAFTPNEDGENDTFLPVVEDGVKVKSFEVFNRWGQVIWSWSHGEPGWNGMIAGGAVRAESGVYIWKMQVKSEANGRTEHTGQVYVLR